jgi:hypothetical protein
MQTHSRRSKKIKYNFKTLHGIIRLSDVCEEARVEEIKGRNKWLNLLESSIKHQYNMCNTVSNFFLPNVLVN